VIFQSETARRTNTQTREEYERLTSALTFVFVVFTPVAAVTNSRKQQQKESPSSSMSLQSLEMRPWSKVRSMFLLAWLQNSGRGGAAGSKRADLIRRGPLIFGTSADNFGGVASLGSLRSVGGSIRSIGEPLLPSRRTKRPSVSSD
jgi:hypothetical protein